MEDYSPDSISIKRLQPVNPRQGQCDGNKRHPVFFHLVLSNLHTNINLHGKIYGTYQIFHCV